MKDVVSEWCKPTKTHLTTTSIEEKRWGNNGSGGVSTSLKRSEMSYSSQRNCTEVSVWFASRGSSAYCVYCSPRNVPVGLKSGKWREERVYAVERLRDTQRSVSTHRNKCVVP